MEKWMEKGLSLYAHSEKTDNYPSPSGYAWKYCTNPKVLGLIRQIAGSDENYHQVISLAEAYYDHDNSPSWGYDDGNPHRAMENASSSYARSRYYELCAKLSVTTSEVYNAMHDAPRRGICGAIYGDIIGLPYVLRASRTKDFNFELKIDDFSDDTILTMAIARWMLDGSLTTDALRRTLLDYSLRFRDKNVWGRGYQAWFESGGTLDRKGVASNGAAMRVSPVAYAAGDINDVLELASLTARLTHDSDEAERGAQAVAAAVYLARQGRDKESVRDFIATRFGYDMQRTVADIRPHYQFELLCDRCVPESIICWLDSDTYEQCVRNAVSLGGDADTMAAIAGGIAAATPGMEVPKELANNCFSELPSDFKDLIVQFNCQFD